MRKKSLMLRDGSARGTSSGRIPPRDLMSGTSYVYSDTGCWEPFTVTRSTRRHWLCVVSDINPKMLSESRMAVPYCFVAASYRDAMFT